MVLRVARVHELQHLALGDGIGGIGQNLHDAHAVEPHHHLKGAGVQEIAHQNAGGIAEHLVGGLSAAAQGGPVDHIVVQQGGGVDEFDDGGGVDVPVPVWPQARAARSTKRGRRRLPPG